MQSLRRVETANESINTTPFSRFWLFEKAVDRVYMTIQIPVNFVFLKEIRPPRSLIAL